MKANIYNNGEIRVTFTIPELLEGQTLDSIKNLTRKIPLSVLLEVVMEKMVELEKFETACL